MENENENNNNNNNNSNNDNVYNSAFSYNSNAENIPAQQPQQTIECITCKSLYESSPLLFSCNHHQCITCFTRKLLLTRFSALSLVNENITFSCPCSSGTIDLTLDKCVEILSSPQQIQPRRCSNHSRPYQVYCPDCNIWLCDQCLNSFHDDLFIHHTTTDKPFITGKNCTVHKKKTTERYCYQCNKHICIECIKHSNKHNNHATLSLKEYKRVIQNKQNKLKYHTYDDIENYLDDKLERLLNKYDMGIEFIKDKIDNCISKLEEIKTEYVEKREVHRQQTKTMFNIVKKVYEAYYKEYNESKFDLGSLEFLEKVNHELLDVNYVSVNVDALNKTMSGVLEFQNVFDIKFVFSNSKKLKNIKTIDTTNEISTLCVLHNGIDFVTGHSNGLISLYHSMKYENGKVLRPTKCEIQKHTRTINTIKELTNSNNNNIRFISCSSDRHINVWECSIDTSNIPSLNCIHTFDKIHTTSVIDIIELNDKRIVSSGADNSLKIWEMQSNNNNNTMDEPIEITADVNYEKCLCKIDDNIIATGSVDRRVKIWNVPRKSVQRFLIGHTSYVNTLLLLKDKKKLISGDGDGLIIVWKLQEHKKKCQYGHKVLSGHSGAIQGIALMNDSQMVSCSNDKSIRVWDLDRLRCEVFLKEGHKSVIYGIGVINDNIIVSGGNDSCIKYFKIRDIDDNDNDYDDEDNDDDNYDDDDFHNDDNDNEFEEYDDDFEEY